MGYIMPVEQYQYQDYHNRITKEERDPFPIEKPYAIQFGIPYRQERTKEFSFAPSIPELEQSTSNHNKHIVKQREVQHSVYAELTGKGGRFQAQV